MNTAETVLISGGTGLIGKYLIEKLREQGYQVNTISLRNLAAESKNRDASMQAFAAESIIGADYIIHLAGAGIGSTRWTKSRRKEIIDSRVNTGKLIFDLVRSRGVKLKAFVTASAIGYYGVTTTDRIYQENDPPADDFLGQVCMKWEQVANQFEELGIRTVKIRMGIVLSKNDGALARMVIPVRYGIGSAIGSGKQYMPWIHIDDLCNIYIKALQDKRMTGAYNAVAPDFKTNAEFMKTIASVLNKPFWFPNIPAFILRMLYGRMADIICKGSRVSSGRIIGAGFDFRFKDLENALKSLLIVDKT